MAKKPKPKKAAKPKKARPKKPKQVIRGLEETARFFKTTPPTVRSWIREGCPVKEEGGNGRPYELDLRAVAKWRSDRTAADAAEAEQRLADDDQLRFELLGDDALPDDIAGGPVSAKARKEALSAELDKVRLAKERRDLVNADDIRDRLVETFSTIRDRLMSLPDQMGRQLGLDDDQIAAGAQFIEDMLTDIADEVATVMDDQKDAAKGDPRAKAA